uniref:Uncharacterized protein n=1 Tax=Ciona savignyi TaxID=51511 RepID=H2YLA3_CIOSA
MREISDERTDGLFALASQQDSKSRQKIRSQRTDDSNRGKINLLPITLICDGIKDAKIMGDVLKVALSSGCQQVYVMEGCVNIWNSSVLKRAAAAHFKIPILPNQQWENMEKLVSHEFPQSVFLSHGGENGSTINDFTNDPEVTRIGKNSGVIETIKRESSVEFNSDEDILVKGHIPPINLDEVVWPKKTNILIVGDITFGAFSFAVKLQNRGANCRVIKLPLSVNGDMLTPTIEVSVLLFDA